MKIPKGFHQITVEQYQQALPVYQKAIEETDPLTSLGHWAVVIAIFTDSQLDDIEKMDIDKLKSIIKKLSWMGTKSFSNRKKHLFYLNGKLYKAPKEAKEFNTSRYVEYMTFYGRNGVIPELHNLLATIYQPYFKSDQTHEQRANEFKKAMIGDVYGTVFFYTKVYKNLMSHIQDCGLRVQAEKLKELDIHLMETLKLILEDIGDGTLQSTR